MNEQYLYDLFGAILAKSTVIAGRFVVTEGYGNDLNTNAMDNVVKDAIGQLSTPQKYPVAILFPPVEMVENRDNGWSRFKLRMFFLETTYHTGLNDIRGIAVDTNTSSVPITQNWVNMRRCAGDFKHVFNQIVRTRSLINLIREIQDVPDVYERYSMMNNDRLSGVSLSFEVELFIGCHSPSDYPTENISAIQLPDLNNYQ